MKFRLAKKLIDKAIEEEEREQYFRLYLCDRPNLKDKLSFNEYLMKIDYKKHAKYSMDNRSTEDIMSEIEIINKKIEAKKKGVTDGTV